MAGFGIEDKLRKGVFESIVNLNQSRINVRMISGDNFETATRCAVKAGIIKEAQVSQEEICMTGARLMEILGEKPHKVITNGKITYEYPPEKKGDILKTVHKTKVIARCTPEQKFAFICALQCTGSSVAVTADGLNDVGALK